MRIARIGTMRQPYPPLEYGGTQRSMSQMTIFQVALYAHDITLYGPASSTMLDYAAEIAGKLGLKTERDDANDCIAIINANGDKGYIRLRSTGHPATAYGNPDEPLRNKELFDLLLQDEAEQPYDIIHNHYKDHTVKSLIPAGLGYKTLTHNHNSGIKFYKQYRYPIICISHSQARILQKRYGVIVYEVMHHGLDSFTHYATEEHAGYLAWIGRFIDLKGAKEAIEIAKRSKRPIFLAGTTHSSNNTSKIYFDEFIRPAIDIEDHDLLNRFAGLSAGEIRQEIKRLGEAAGTDTPVIFVGPADEAQKQTLYGNAMATLFPIKWPEPFGRVMIESMACGTPVIGYVNVGDVFCGSVEEVIEDGVTGFHVRADNDEDGIDKAVAAVARVEKEIDRKKVRQVFDRDWSSERLARQIDETYKRFLNDPERFHWYDEYDPWYKKLFDKVSKKLRHKEAV